MTKDQAQAFRCELQQARENAFKDSEAFDGIIHIIERLGQFLFEKIGDLGKYEPKISELAAHSPLAYQVADEWRTIHQPFKQLYREVRNARNDAIHIGAEARTLTDHAIQLSLILEDALRVTADDNFVSDFMVRNPIIAELWQPVSFARQVMLTNSFSYLPMRMQDGKWKMLSDRALATYLQNSPTNSNRKERLAKPLESAELAELPLAEHLLDSEPISSILAKLDGPPCLVFRTGDDQNPVGILTAFDVL